MMTLAAMQRMKMPILEFSEALGRACLYTRRRHGSRNYRGGVIRSAFRFRPANVGDGSNASF
jgi:hypothetical protein